ncbi:Oidioi.mRNA.OKI2018_I69.chr2.g3963.t1.cds [Oikopleura dioica]|uniref:Oidioi.mRNA.OKI2018_I69.chr2.g3963.t1.cds n=1 Tax=Oikopleura dioica TaxID=34765 RepID=A0ABN7SXH0_OIKDI|nr:Oidioi.mRNA.OKI2018_I69.chr2.g3963.t1.cds [Oikopleura dioica]
MIKRSFFGSSKIFTVCLKGLVNAKDAEEEFKIMKTLDHRNILKVFEGFSFSNEDIRYFAITMEFMTAGDLGSFIERKAENPENWAENQALQIICQFVNGISYIHSKEILHRDIKPSNVFIGERMRVVVGDFDDEAVASGMTTTNLLEIVGTEYYLPPEVINRNKGDQLTFARDIWAMGVVIYQTAYLTHPFLDKNEEHIKTLFNIYEANQHEPETIFSRCQDLIDVCLRKDQLQRVENASLLAKNARISGLIEQLEFGVDQETLEYSEEAVDVVRRINQH